MATILDWDKPKQQPQLQTYIPSTKQTLTGQNAVDYLAKNGGSQQQVQQAQAVVTPPAQQQKAPIPGFAPPPTPQQQANLAAATQRAQPTVATTNNPLITKNQLPTTLKSPQQNDQQMLETMAMKQYKNQPLSDDEVKFQIRQGIQNYQAPQAAGKNFMNLPQRSTYSSEDGYNRAMAQYQKLGGTQQPIPASPAGPNLPTMPAQSNPVLQQNQPQQNNQQGGYWRANISGAPLKVPLPGQYQSEDQFAQTDPAGYDQWATQNGYHYSTDDQNYSATPPQNFNIQDYLNATPEQQIQMQQQGFNQQSQQQVDMLNKGFDTLEETEAAKLAREQGRYDAEKKNLETGDQTKIDQFKADQTAQDQTAISQINKAAEKNVENIKDISSFSGFGRSTKTMEIIDQAGEQTKSLIADVERQSKSAVTQYQASLLDKTQQRLDKLQDRLDATQDEKDGIAVQRVKAQIDLQKDLFSQNPSNPKNLAETAQKLQQMQIDKRKMDFEEKQAVEQSARQNFQFMVGSFGSSYLKNLDDASISNLAKNLNVPPAALKNVGPTLQEADTAWKKYIDTRNFDYQKENDTTARSFQWALNQENNRQELDKMGIGFQQDVSKMYLGEQFKNAESQRKYAGLTYGEFAPQASQITENYMEFEQPVNHPATGAPVTAMNTKLANAYPPGYKKAASSGPAGLGGQCAYEVGQMSTCGPLGSSIPAKTATLNKFIQKGQGFLKGQGTPQPGDILISSLSKQYGHAALVNAIDADGEPILSEFNVKGALKFSNDRKPNPDEVIGYIRVPLKPQYQMDAKANASYALNKSTQGMDPNSQLYKLMMGLSGQMSGNQQQSQGSYDQQNQDGNVDENGYKLTPDRMAVRNGTLPETIMNKRYQDLSEAVNAGALPPEALRAFEDDMAIGLEKTQKAQGKDFTQANQLYARYDGIGKEIRTLDQGVAIAKDFDINTTNPYDDQKLIFAFMKVQDPGSVVREGEFNYARDLTTKYNAVASQFGLATKGNGILQPHQRKQILSAMSSLYQNKRAEYDPILQNAIKTGQSFGITDPSTYLDYLPQGYGQQNNQQSGGANNLLSKYGIGTIQNGAPQGAMQSGAQSLLSKYGI